LLSPTSPIKNYFETKSPIKDRVLATRLSRMVVNSNVEIDENNLKLSILEAKKRDYRNIDNKIAQEQLKINPNLSDEEYEKESRRLDKQMRANNKVTFSESELRLLKIKNKQYSISEIYKIQKNIQNNNNQIKTNQNKTRRIALTELGHAYNLGRLETYVQNKVELIKLNNSIEHLNRNVVKKELWQTTDMEKEFMN
jgi:hypothetical protein